MRLSLCVALFWAAAFPMHVRAAQPSESEVWVPGFEMRIATYSLSDAFRGTPFEEFFDLDSPSDSDDGVRIVELDPDGPAARAGLTPDDVSAVLQAPKQ